MMLRIEFFTVGFFGYGEQKEPIVEDERDDSKGNSES